MERLLERFTSRVPDPHGLARRARVVLVRTAAGIPVEVTLGALDFEERSVARSTPWEVPDTAPLRTCGAEDLVVHKVFAGRDRDWSDVAGVITRQGGRLDVDLIVTEVTPLLRAKGAMANLERLRQLLDDAAGP
ncbi:MAG TPA: hypothetical protein VNT56_02605 [Acidimicrobiales bacterium]|nr:hypothetical protein [Acidimicrobiales bacterium]